MNQMIDACKKLGIVSTTIAGLWGIFQYGISYNKGNTDPIIQNLKTQIKNLENSVSKEKSNDKINKKSQKLTSVETKPFSDYRIYYNFNEKNRNAGLEMTFNPQETAKIDKSKQINVVIDFDGSQEKINLCLFDRNSNRECKLLSKNEGRKDPKTYEYLFTYLKENFSTIDGSSIAKISFDAKGIAPYENAGRNDAGFKVTKVEFQN